MKIASRKKPPKRRKPRLSEKRKKSTNEKRLIIDASKEKDQSVLPAKRGNHALAKNGTLVTLDRLAEEVGGRSEFINMCRLSDVPEVMEFVRKCEVEGEGLALEKILDSMSLKGGVVVSSIASALYEYQGNVTKIITALGSTGAAQANAMSAKLLGLEGFQDRKLLLQMMGLVPKEGTTVIGQVNVSGGMEKPEATYSGIAQRVEDDEP